MTFLFDLDGTLINSLPAVDRSWARWAESVGLAPQEVLPFIHGRRSLDSIRLLAPHLDPEHENDILRAIESTDLEGVEVLPGSLEFLASLPDGSWTIVTSGTSDVATARMRAMGIPIPPHAVFGEDVQNGKPAPDPYLLAAERMGAEPRDCVVFEDTQAGVTAGKTAGMRVVAICQLHPGVQYEGTDHVIRNLSELRYDGAALTFLD